MTVTMNGNTGTERSRYWIDRFRPNGMETFAEAKARYAELIKDEDVEHWKEHGYVIIERFLSPEELTEVHHGLQQYMPTWEEYDSHRPLYSNLYGDAKHMKGSNAETVRKNFPYADDALNQVAVHPFLVAFAERLAQIKELTLAHGVIVGKYAGKGEYDQPLHVDYSDNTYVVPSRNPKWIEIPMIIYHSDVTAGLGPTNLVSKKHTQDRKLANNGFRLFEKNDYPELYQVEQSAIVPAGSVLIYSMDVFHRGTGMTASSGARFVQHTSFFTSAAPWMGSMFYKNETGRVDLNRFIVTSDPGQRALIGFPPVGSEYWEDKEALEGVARRYPSMDMRPYGGSAPRNPGGLPVGTTPLSTSTEAKAYSRF